ncbi:MAG TPA: PhoH family protein [Thermodesulfovibrionales bacterium]|nr:PhoH family protein [Thermodesulfovibrionales bacterium]
MQEQERSRGFVDQTEKFRGPAYFCYFCDAGECNTSAIEIEFDSEKEPDLLYGRLEKILRIIGETLGIIVSQRGNKIFLQGDDGSIQKAANIIQDIRSISSEGYNLNPEDIRYALRSIASDEHISIKDLFLNNIPVSSKKRFIIPKTETQSQYIEAIRNFDIVIGIGPAGTGKTYLAMAMAINALLKKQISRIVLARPAVEAGEKLGFLPGDMFEKVNPYFRPLYDALFDMIEAEKVAKLIDRGTIEIAPLAFMRGRTLNDSFIILDEAQNTTSEQMKMYLTRLGYNSKTVITGDITQIDLPHGRASGLILAEKILNDIDGIKFIYFSERDVVRHKLVQEIVKAYEKYEKRSAEE